MEETFTLLEYESVERNNIPGKKLNMTRLLKMMGILTFPSYDLDHSILSLYLL